MKLELLLKSKSFWTLVSAIVAALAAFFLSSCAHSAMLFKGQGDVEFMYKGAAGAQLPSERK